MPFTAQHCLEELAVACPGLRVSVNVMDRLAYARDASAVAFLERREGVLPAGPAAVVWPDSDEHVAKVVKCAARHGVELVPYGAGSGVVRGVEPGRDAMVMDLKGLDEVSVDVARRQARVGAGVLGERMERALNAQGFSAGHFPSSIYCSTVGGWAATRSAGQLSSRYGKVEDMIVSVRAVDGQGRVLTACRGQSPDLLRLLLGSEGALAIITSVTLHIHPLPTHRVLMGLAAPDVGAGVAVMRRVMQAGLRPAVLRMYDPADTILAGGLPAPSAPAELLEGAISRAGHEDPFMRPVAQARHGLTGLIQRRGEALARRWTALGSLTPTFRSAVSGVLDHTRVLELLASSVPPSCLMVLGLEGSRDEVQEGMDALDDVTGGTGVTLLGAAPGERWLRRRHAVTYKMPPVIRAGAWADTLEVATTWENLVPLYHATRSALAPHAVTLAHFSHAYPDGASVYFTLVGGGAGLEEARMRHDEAVAEALDVFARFGAAISHHHGLGRLKVAPVPAVLGRGGMAAWWKLKHAFDPQGILNPGVLGLQGRAAS